MLTSPSIQSISRPSSLHSSVATDAAMAAKGPRSVHLVAHPEHRLTRRRRVYGGFYGCDICQLSGSGWVYHCVACHFDAHPECALAAEKIKDSDCDGEEEAYVSLDMMERGGEEEEIECEEEELPSSPLPAIQIDSPTSVLVSTNQELAPGGNFFLSAVDELLERLDREQARNTEMLRDENAEVTEAEWAEEGV